MSLPRICIVTAEIAPFSKTGGLADVTAALSRHLAASGHEVLAISPLHPSVTHAAQELRPVVGLEDMGIELGGRRFGFSVAEARLPRSALSVHFVHCPALFARESIYTDDADEHLRFALLSRAAIEVCQWLQWRPDVFHCHDWHTALIPLYLRTLYSWDRLFERTRTVLTIHNLPHQGIFPAAVVDEIGLANERRFLQQEKLRAGFVSFLETGLLHADVLTTVSETYAREIQTPEFGVGLDGILRARAADLVGILNGVDHGEWDPATDELVPHRYSLADLRGKARNRKALLERMGLAPKARGPVFGIVSRLTHQKGLEIVPAALRAVLRDEDARLAVLGSGEARYERAFVHLCGEFPDRVGYDRGFDEPLAHLIEAGSDMFLMPSRYEPAGLNQMYSMRYGTIPIVRRTGGLADTVRPFDPATGEGTGFLFDEFSPAALAAALRRALEVYRDRAQWTRLMKNAMSENFSWNRAGELYARLFARLAARR